MMPYGMLREEHRRMALRRALHAARDFCEEPLNWRAERDCITGRSRLTASVEARITAVGGDTVLTMERTGPGDSRQSSHPGFSEAAAEADRKHNARRLHEAGQAEQAARLQQESEQTQVRLEREMQELAQQQKRARQGRGLLHRLTLRLTRTNGKDEQGTER